ncbi:hypothetical protein DYB37_009457 [Aphanomyces astaci]|uniref:Major facilitator superfamily (MFS) profile domain-containing protein n=1 Tax=Aphanomyces astaci TaxID=112090 RepID=A0A3R7AXE7_APHAT|nr:hypothetical protein DYB37_009457 [Aphanomyces astaci]
MPDDLWPAKVTNTISWLALSTIVIYLPVFYNAYFDKLQIGVLAAIPCVCSMLPPPLWGAVADLVGRQRWVHIICLVSGTGLMYVIQFTSSSFAVTCLVVFLANFQMNPTASLMDQAVMALVQRVGGEYGKQRLFGAIGWGVGAFCTGLVVNAYGISWAFHLHLILLVPNLYALSFLPAPKPHHHDHPTDPSALPASFAHSLRYVCCQADLMLLLVVVLLMGIMVGVIASFISLNLYELSGNSTTIVGTAIWLETLSELPAFFFAESIVKRIGIVYTLLLSILAYGARITCYAVMTSAWMALPFELLHGVTFALAWAACTQYVYEAAPPGTEGTMMGLLNSVLNGLGRGVGTLAGGYVYNTYGPRCMWWTADLGVPMALVGLALFARTRPTQQGNSSKIARLPLLSTPAKVAAE